MSGVDPLAALPFSGRPQSTMSHPLLRRSRAGILSALLAGGCASVDGFARESDAIVEDILGGSGEQLDTQRRATIVQPERRPPEAQAPAAEDGGETQAPPAADAPTEARLLSLKDALDLAVRGNREYISQRESLYEQALALYGVRHSFTPLLSSTLGYVFADADGAQASSGASWSGGVSQKLPWGGDLSAGVGVSHAGGPAADPHTFSTSASIRLSQPLLRGAGREIALEPLTQAERGMLYAVRRFELFREGFSIDVAQRFYGLVQQKRSLENQRRNIEGLVFQRRQAEAMLKLGDGSELEVLRARRSELTSQNDLIGAEENIRLSLDQFRIFLGLPQGESIDVRDEAPEFVEIEYEVESAVAVAFQNRLDVLNERDALEDAARGLRIAENVVLPQLDLDLSYGLGGRADPSLAHQTPFDQSYGAALSLNLPVDRTSDRSSLRSAQIGYRQTLRDHEQYVQDIEVQIRSKFRELARGKQSLEIQRQLINDQERNVKIAQLRYEQGDFSNRDVVEAQQSLLEARNALIQEQVDYEIARLGLIRDLGILFIDEHGMWTE